MKKTERIADDLEILHENGIIRIHLDPNREDFTLPGVDGALNLHLATKCGRTVQLVGLSEQQITKLAALLVRHVVGE